MSDKYDFIQIYQNKYVKQKKDNLIFVNDDDAQFDFVVRYLPKDFEARILDAGCGLGKYMNAIKDLGYKNVYGIDVFDNSEKIVEGNYYQADIAETPFEDNYFDLIICLGVINHVNYPYKVISEFNRILKNGGTIILTGHTKYSLFTLDRKIKLLVNFKKVSHLKSAKFYSTFAFIDMMKKNNFSIEECDGWRFSYINYVLIRRVFILLKMLGLFHYKRKRPLNKRNKLVALIRSIFSYFFIIVAKK